MNLVVVEGEKENTMLKRNNACKGEGFLTLKF
jgi:hypothetical protein